MDACICAEPLRVGQRIKPCPLHGFFGEKNPPDLTSPDSGSTEEKNND